MKNVTLALILLLIVGLGAAVAQDAHQSKALKRQSFRNQECVATSTVSSVASTVSRKATCDGSGRGYGDGSKPRPQDGTGFGARAQKRQHRNAGNGKRQRNQFCNGSCASSPVQINRK